MLLIRKYQNFVDTLVKKTIQLGVERGWNKTATRYAAALVFFIGALNLLAFPIITVVVATHFFGLSGLISFFFLLLLGTLDMIAGMIVVGDLEKQDDE